MPAFKLVLPALMLVSMILAGCVEEEVVVAGEPKKVDVIEVLTKRFTQTDELPGRVTPVRVAEVRARVAGIILKREFVEGADVKAGQVLFRIDPAPFKAVLSRAEAELAKAEADTFNADSVARRYRALAEQRAISQQELDAAEATLKSAQAAKMAAQANIETAKLDLDYATVRAPISGRIGRAFVTEGALVGQGEATPMATIQQLDPIFVDFSQSIEKLIQTREAIEDGRLSTNESGDAIITLTIDGSSRTREGHLLFSDIGVDQTSNQVSLRGRFPNSDKLLLPGMYVRIQMEQGEYPQAVLIPQRAISRSTDGKPQVLVVGQDNIVEARLVETGAMHGSEWHILKGLEAGEQIIVGGASTVMPADTVIPQLETAKAERVTSPSTKI
ncbi:efflux RND transporter periplasmic adaptor subunit [Methylophaga sp.]|uniref:efflux RND transporter periplasmic adaptor subunit n=1 Tax=Methylophaga sp. TaxID=2024840 RepID=UPI003A906010